MSSINELIGFLSSEFPSVGDISDEWVSSSVEGDYNDFATISAVYKPSFYDDDRATLLLRRLFNNLAKFEQECDDSEIWNEMTKIGISGKQLCVLLWYSVEWAQAKNSTFELCERGALAACAYLYLASITGSKAYTIFNPHLYKKCLLVFRSLYRCLTYDSRGAAKSKSKIKQMKNNQEEVTDENEVDEDTFFVKSFDREGVKHLLEESTETLFVLLNKVSLSGYSGMPHDTAMLIRDLARIDVCADAKVEVVENLRDFRNLRRFVDRSFALMHRLIDERHTINGYIVISRIIYPRLAYWTFDYAVIPSSSTIPVLYTVWKDLMVKFIKVRAGIGNMGELMTFFEVGFALFV
ncbi:unnamed protein product [Strongylus vulgaris]|uniref:Uncharacterized protein n=1 Tax=Strongylus vulgaris TaxID=40348 RepID=A0A3P7IRA7_STRVU|nr:unnamed protein product [Strongylus vulgaris]